ncbi:hypothetical protein DSM112329_01784 [Paraconexibacter sp. AEG42_29]|uniref:Antibiotic biosynthesis monooxygenase n=1 Tax=Paraconexibacter sp. AEG42_29 TaxID=2997339 RepID=A0AAU7ATM4_9ACTN
MAGSVHIPWYATGFRGDKLEAAVADFAALSLRYGANAYSVFRGRDDRYKILQVVEFDQKADWEAYWNGPEAIRFRTINSGYYQVPVVYAWQDLVTKGDMRPVVEQDLAADTPNVPA